MEPKTGTLRQAVGLLITAALCGLFSLTSGCGGSKPTFISKKPEGAPLVVKDISISVTDKWYEGATARFSADVTGGATPYSYAWTFTGFVEPSPSFSSYSSPVVQASSYVYPARISAVSGTVYASVTITDSSRRTQTSTFEKDFDVYSTYRPGFPTIMSNVVGTWYAGTPGAIFVDGFDDPTQYQLAWTFSGTSNPTPTSSTQPSTVVTPASQGTLHVALHITDSSTPPQSGDVTPVDFTIAGLPPLDDTLYVTTDKDTYAVGETVQITANVKAIANSMNQFDACRIAFTSPATGHYLMYQPGPSAITLKLGPDLILDPAGTDDGFFTPITHDPTNPRTWLHLPIGYIIDPDSIPALNNQTETVDGIAGTYDLRDFAVIWQAGGVSPFPEVPAGASGAAFTVFEKVQSTASGQDIHIGIIPTEGATDRTYYTNQAGGATKLTFAHTQGVTIHIS